MNEFGLERKDLFITTKIPPSHQGYDKAKEIIQQSLTNLGLEYIDLMLIHWPGVNSFKKTDSRNQTVRHETWRAMEEFVEKGLIKSIGVSNFLPRHIEALLEVAKIKPVINQIEIHPLYVEWDTIECCQKNNILV